MKYNIMSEERRKEVQVFFRDYPSLDDGAIILYANFVEIVDILTHHKLDTNIILIAYDVLSDLILNKKPNITVHVPKEDRIKAQVGLMNSMPPIADKLDMEEKVLFAFCVYWSVCARIYDEDTNKIYTGLVDFTSVEKIRAQYEQAKIINPELFDNCSVVNDEPTEDYGYSPEHPIKATSVAAAYDFLNRLAVKDATVTYVRLGSCSGKQNHIIDQYRITVTTKKLLKRKTQIYQLYIDPYCAENSQKAPEPFYLLS